jgi:hypothetical protein
MVFTNDFVSAAHSVLTGGPEMAYVFMAQHG